MGLSQGLNQDLSPRPGLNQRPGLDFGLCQIQGLNLILWLSLCHGQSLRLDIGLSLGYRIIKIK